jgi:microcystin-dependent protein
MSGTENTTLTIQQMPMHNHTYSPLASENDATSKLPLNNFLGSTPSNNYVAGQDGTKMGGQATDLAGGNQPFSIIQPYLCVNFIICLEGIFPSRN